MSKSLLERPDKPSIVGLYGHEITDGKPCACGHRLVRPDMREHWYYSTHSLTNCTLELPDLMCWCRLKRSEHVDGHADVPYPGAPDSTKEQG